MMLEIQAIYMDHPGRPTWMFSVHLISQDIHKDKYNHFVSGICCYGNQC
jgi:hypothetical protein